MSFTVGQLAKRTGLTVRALHHYHAIGLLVPSHRSESGYRLYTQSDVARLFQIQALQRLGLSLSEIETVLEKGGAALPDMIGQQIEELSDRIEHATLLRTRLVQLRSVLAQGEEPVATDWLAVVELISAYDQYCSPEELKRLLAHAKDRTDDLPILIADIRDAMARDVAPESEEAQALTTRWKQIVMSRIGGDITLAIKMKLAYFDNPDLKARFETRTGYDASVEEYLGRIWRHSHLAAWSRVLGAEDAGRLQLSDGRTRDWLFAVAEMRGAMNDGVAPDSESVQRILQSWEAIAEHVAGGDVGLRERMLQALAVDGELQANWALDAELLAFVDRARAGRRREGIHVA